MLYCDTGFLVSLHSRDANTDNAIAFMMHQEKQSLVWTWLHDLEFPNAMRLRVFRKEISELECRKVLMDIDSLLVSHRYERVAVSPIRATEEAKWLSEVHTMTLGARSLDIFHVAQALVLGVRNFLTFDKRQTDLAKAAGLQVPISG